MTRKSKRELEQAVEDLGGGDDDSPTEIVIRRQVIKTGWSGDGGDYGDDDAEPGDVIEETEKVIEL